MKKENMDAPVTSTGNEKPRGNKLRTLLGFIAGFIVALLLPECGQTISVNPAAFQGTVGKVNTATVAATYTSTAWWHPDRGYSEIEELAYVCQADPNKTLKGLKHVLHPGKTATVAPGWCADSVPYLIGCEELELKVVPCGTDKGSKALQADQVRDARDGLVYLNRAKTRSSVRADPARIAEIARQIAFFNAVIAQDKVCNPPKKATSSPPAAPRGGGRGKEPAKAGETGGDIPAFPVVPASGELTWKQICKGTAAAGCCDIAAHVKRAIELGIPVAVALNITSFDDYARTIKKYGFSLSLEDKAKIANLATKCAKDLEPPKAPRK